MKFLEKIDSFHVLKAVLLIVYLFPLNGAYQLNGIPIDSKKDLIFFFLFLLTLKVAKNKNIIFFITIFLIFKISISFLNDSMWTICVNDDLTPTQNTFQYDYFNSRCTKSFDDLFSNSEYTVKTWEVNYRNLNEEYQWMGANSSNFPIGYLNHSKFNTYELRRDWLPFRLFASKNIKEEKFLNVDYVGEVTINFLPNNQQVVLVERYLNPLNKKIQIPENTDRVEIYYKFTKWKFKPIPEIKSGYPYEFYGKIIIDDGESTIVLELISYLLIIGFIVSNLNNFSLSSKDCLIIFCLLLVIYLKQLDFSLPFNIFSLIGYLMVFYCFLYKNTHNIIFIFLSITFLIIDAPWDSLNFLVKPAGSDILTYENQARLIFEGDGLRGGASVFWYSPGYRYFLYLIHSLFGDGWLVSWQLILSLCVFLLSEINQRVNLTTFVFALFLLLDNVRSIFLFGMSETISLLFLLFSIYLLKINKDSTQSVILLSLAVLIRPELIIFSIAFIFFKFKEIKNISIFLIMQLLPMFHNFYFGNKFVFYSTAGTYQRNISFDIVENLNYLIFNPFNELLIIALGRYHIYIGFFVVSVSLFLYIINLNFSSLLNIFNNFVIFGLLCLAPYLIFDPKLFYPRHVIIGICLMSLNENYTLNDKLRNLWNIKNKLI
tara:strand:- start:7607 stop:9580 length:1974 start_codon:yes stop_codon:yes gene_type:complete